MNKIITMGIALTLTTSGLKLYAQKDTLFDTKKMTITITEKRVKSGDSLSADSSPEKKTVDIGFKEHTEEKKRFTTDMFNMQIGLNNLLNSQGEFEMPANYQSMEISTGSSVNFQLHFVQQALNLYKDQVRLVYGIGIDFNNYRFVDNVDLSKDSLGVLAANINPNRNYKKNKLVTKYLTVPFMLDFELWDDVTLGFGANFGYLIGSHQKQKWSDGGNQKSKVKDDYNLQKYRMGYEVQFGYGKVILYAKYFPESIFKQDKGPEMRSVSAGILIGHI